RFATHFVYSYVFLIVYLVYVCVKAHLPTPRDATVAVALEPAQTGRLCSVPRLGLHTLTATLPILLLSNQHPSLDPSCSSSLLIPSNLARNQIGGHVLSA
uniref:Uncharacterized protein n=1 Tax=Aegilops tauschii subsp. strangulata TaxID=200361 RepID=A0A453R154_AEGTS